MNIKNKVTVIYHSADFDGLFCREIARMFLPEAELIGWDFKDKPLDTELLKSGKLVIMDLPVDRVFGLEFRDGWICRGEQQIQPIDRWDSTTIIWIDHHKSSIDSHPSSIPGYRIDGVSACRLAWQWFTLMPCGPRDAISLVDKEAFVSRNVIEPVAVRLAGEYDVWDKRDPDAETFQFGLRSEELSDFKWAQLLSEPAAVSLKEIEESIEAGHPLNLRPDGRVDMSDGVVKEFLQRGQLLQSYQRGIDAGVMQRSFMVEFEGLKFLALNAVRFNSLTFRAKDMPAKGHDALLGFYFDGEKFNFSLYHAQHNTGVDLSLIAKRYGGGGHRGACGFITPFMNISGTILICSQQ